MSSFGKTKLYFFCVLLVGATSVVVRASSGEARALFGGPVRLPGNHIAVNPKDPIAVQLETTEPDGRVEVKSTQQQVAVAMLANKLAISMIYMEQDRAGVRGEELDNGDDSEQIFFTHVRKAELEVCKALLRFDALSDLYNGEMLDQQLWVYDYLLKQLEYAREQADTYRVAVDAYTGNFPDQEKNKQRFITFGSSLDWLFDFNQRRLSEKVVRRTASAPLPSAVQSLSSQSGVPVGNALQKSDPGYLELQVLDCLLDKAIQADAPTDLRQLGTLEPLRLERHDDEQS